MPARTTIQLALLIVGLVAWGWGIRVDDERFRWLGLGCFGLAFVLRLLRKYLADR